jgi:hypothetical protein
LDEASVVSRAFSPDEQAGNPFPESLPSLREGSFLRGAKGDDYSRPDPDDMPVVGGGLSLKASTDELRTEPNEQDELPDGGGGLPVEAPNRTRTKSYAVGRTFLSDLDGQECPFYHPIDSSGPLRGEFRTEPIWQDEMPGGTGRLSGEATSEELRTEPILQDEMPDGDAGLSVETLIEELRTEPNWESDEEIASPGDGDSERGAGEERVRTEPKTSAVAARPLRHAGRTSRGNRRAQARARAGERRRRLLDRDTEWAAQIWSEVASECRSGLRPAEIGALAG